jgi:hypothetical protein
MPIHLIGARWFLTPIDIPQPDLDQLTLDDLSEMTPAGSDSESEDAEVEAPLIAIQGSVRGPKAHQIYDRIFKLGKTAASIATKLLPEQQETFYQDMKRLIENVRPSVVDVGDALASPSGRPRKEYHSKPHPVGSVCQICSSCHVMQDCPHFAIFQEVKLTWQAKDGTGRRCGLCLFRGHTRKTCPVLHEARKRLRLT